MAEGGLYNFYPRTPVGQVTAMTSVGGSSKNWTALKNSGYKPSKGSLETFVASKQKEKKNELWFDDVDEDLLHRSRLETKGLDLKSGNNHTVIPKLCLENLFRIPKDEKKASDIGKFISVSIKPSKSTDELVDRVVIVNYHGKVVLDHDLKAINRDTNSQTFFQVQSELAHILDGKRIIIGYDLGQTLKPFMLQQSRKVCRDIRDYQFPGGVGLVNLSESNNFPEELSKSKRHKSGESAQNLQKHTESSILDSKSEILENLLNTVMSINCVVRGPIDEARAAMLLYRSQKSAWENKVFRNEY